MEYFYAYGLLFILPFTIFVFLKADKRERIKLFITGSGFGLMAVAFDYIYTDYWHPIYLINSFHFEDYLYGLLFGGMLTVIRNIYRKKSVKGKMGFDIKLGITYCLILLSIFYVTVNVLKLNYIYALCLVPLIVGIISYIKVKGNIKDVLVTVIFALLVTIFFYNAIILIYPNVIDIHFFMDNLIGIKLFNIPIEEIFFPICLGVGATYTYEAIFKLK